MPVATPRFEVKPWNRPAQTKEELDWAPLRIIDLSTFDEPGGKEKLAAELADSVKNGEYDACQSRELRTDPLF